MSDVAIGFLAGTFVSCLYLAFKIGRLETKVKKLEDEK